MKWVEDIKRFIFPIYCLQCKNPLANKTELFCLPCYGLLPKTQHFEQKFNDCYHQLIQYNISLEFVATLFYFEEKSVLKRSIHLLKYQQKTDIGYFFGIQLGRSAINVSSFIDAQYIIPLPLHKNKLRSRGYNQSLWIAKGVASILNLPIANKAIKRIKETATQTKMNKEQRQKNMKDAFEWTEDYPEGTHFIIVDDVVTTGSSIVSLILSSEKNYKFSILCIGFTR